MNGCDCGDVFYVGRLCVVVEMYKVFCILWKYVGFSCFFVGDYIFRRVVIVYMVGLICFLLVLVCCCVWCCV